jgi:DNA-directed RNA polymerase specialized sigma24 family protein
MRQEDADDLKHDLLIRLLESNRTYDPSKGCLFETWLTSISFCELVDMHRAKYGRYCETKERSQLSQRRDALNSCYSYEDYDVILVPKPQTPVLSISSREREILSKLDDLMTTFIVLKAKQLMNKEIAASFGCCVTWLNVKIRETFGDGFMKELK